MINAKAVTLLSVAVVCLAQDMGLQASYTAIRKLRAAGAPSTANDTKALAVAYYAAGQHLLFRMLMNRAMQLDPADPEPHYLLGRHYASDVQDHTKAADYYRAALALKPDPVVSAHLGNAIELTGDSTSALRYYREAMRAGCQPLAAAGLARLGAVKLDVLDRCGGAHPMLLRERAKLRSTAGRHLEAARDLEQVVRQEPASTAAVYQLYRAYLAAGEKAKAAASLEHYRKLQAVYGGQ
ncbi:MAG: hypothetical protein FJW39_20830 [Acidobacteria bacterium]|nr:hypothetical protein [Acidobacteriota bacterium]